ncbi:MAG: head decoration protein [Desulfotalea sp.]
MVAKKVITDAVKWEVDTNFSRETVTVANGVTLAILQVVGQTTATGKYKGLDPASTTGSEDAAGIALADIDASGGDVSGVILNRDAIVIMDELVWPEGITTEQKATAIEQLSAKGIKAATSA